MKALNFFTIILITALFLSSCKDEEEGTPQQVTKTFTYSHTIRGSEGVKGELPLEGINLSDIIGADAAQNLEDAEMQLADSYLEISGLNQLDTPDSVVVMLEDFTIKVGSRQGVNIGDCTTDPQSPNEFAADIQQSTNTVVNLIRNIFSDVTSGSKSTEITVSFTPNVNITSSDNVQLIISFGGTYYYLVFD
jgi:hypothetical protein